MTAKEIIEEIFGIAKSEHYRKLSVFVAERQRNPRRIGNHRQALAAFLRLRRKIKQRVLAAIEARQKMAVYRVIRRRMPAFAKAIYML